MVCKRMSALLLLPLGLVALAGCRDDGMDIIRAQYEQLAAVAPTRWDILAGQKIFFGHQSVGGNILDGLGRVMEQNPGIRLDIQETSDPTDFVNPVFAHFPIGRNMDPQAKIDDFKNILKSGVGRVADIAMFKFCFVDVDGRTDLAALFTAYEKAIASLQAGFPNLRIITFTVPLTNTPKGFKATIKRVLGMIPSPADDNKARNLFNAMLRERFGGSVFDLAEAEATLLGGGKTTFKAGAETYWLMNPAYTQDGGHLNALGQQVVAIELLRFLLDQLE